MEDFSQLLEKFIAETLKPSALPEFLSRAGDPANQSLIKQELAQKMESDDWVDLSEGADLEALFGQVLGRASLQEKADSEKPASLFRRPWFRYAAAAIVLFLAAGSVLFIAR